MSLWPGLPQCISDRLRACSTLQLLKSDLLSDQSRHVCSQVNVWFCFVFSGSTKCDEAVTTVFFSIFSSTFQYEWRAVGWKFIASEREISDVVEQEFFPLPSHHRHHFKSPMLHHPFSIYHTNGGFIKSKACGCDDGTGTSIVCLICQICSGLVETQAVLVWFRFFQQSSRVVTRFVAFLNGRRVVPLFSCRIHHTEAEEEEFTSGNASPLTISNQGLSIVPSIVQPTIQSVN